MLLRGDNPRCYTKEGVIDNTNSSVLEWDMKGLIYDQDCIDARKQNDVCQLYYQYHYDSNGKLNGQKFEEWEIDEEMCQMIKLVQEELLKEVERRGIAIECNPTSNFKIGDFDRYDEHPIIKFNNNGLNILPRHDISTSINTDDKGVFSTSIEREYALIAHAMIRYFRSIENDTNDRDIYDWIDRIRENSLEQRFDKL